MKTLELVIPILDINTESEKTLFDRCIKSISEQIELPNAITILLSSECKNKSFFNDYDFKEIKKLVTIRENKNGYTFQNQINEFAKECKSDYFSFIEFDDYISPKYVQKFNEYIIEYKSPEILTSIIKCVDSENKFIGLSNEYAWGYGVTKKQGYYDNESLLTYNNFNLSGSFIKTSDFIDNGGIKENIELTFNHEFALRMTYNDAKIYVIPKSIYTHTVRREGSLFSNYESTLTESELKHWFTIPSKEFYFTKARDISFSK